MNVPAKLGAFAGVLVLAFGGAVAVGNAAGPVGPIGATPHGPDHAQPAAVDGAEHGGDGHGSDAAPAASARAATAADIPGGLAMSQQGYTLRLADSALPAGQPAELRLTVHGPSGAPLTEYTPTHDKELHLIVVRRDMTGFQHLHPERDAAGTWSTPLTLPAAGEYRVFTDFAPEGTEQPITLGADLSAPGQYDPRPLAEPTRTATVDGYEVSLSGDLVAGEESELTLTVTRQGQPVTDLQPYLAAYGHLVALRDGDLAYLHVHPDGHPGDGRTPAGPQITFYATAPTEGDYGLFLDFQHQGVVRTAAFTARAAAAGDAPQPPAAPASGEDHGSDGHAH